jgi:hypothetical protein
MNFMAVSGAILITLVPLPLKKLFAPPSLKMSWKPCIIPIGFPEVCAYKITFNRSSGAVIVLEIAPATPPETKVVMTLVPGSASSLTTTDSPISIYELLAQRLN